MFFSKAVSRQLVLIFTVLNLASWFLFPIGTASSNRILLDIVFLVVALLHIGFKLVVFVLKCFTSPHPDFFSKKNHPS